MTRVPNRAAACLAIAACAAATGTPAAAAAAGPCGIISGPPPHTYRHVVVIMDENKSFSDIIGPRGSTARRQAPYLNALASGCGLATNYRGITHPSHPNYMAATGGIRTEATYVDRANIFRQVRRSHRAWRSYNESMGWNCRRSARYPYKPEHNPGIAYARIARDCPRWDVTRLALAADIAENALPAYSFITPNQCHNMHASCRSDTTPVRAGDDWLRTWVGRLVHTPDYLAGRTAIFITWDEGSHGQSPAKRGENCLARVHRHDETCHVPALVLSAYVNTGARGKRFYSHYSLLHTCERLLGFHRFIGHAGDATTAGMRESFGL